MKMKKMITALAVSVALGGTLALPTTASAHEGGHEKRVKVIKTIEHRDRDNARHHHRHQHDDRWYLKRHREARGYWAPPRHGHKHHHRKHAHKHHKKHHGHERRHSHYRVEHDRPRHRHYDDGLRVHIGYDFWM